MGAFRLPRPVISSVRGEVDRAFGSRPRGIAMRGASMWELGQSTWYEGIGLPNTYDSRALLVLAMRGAGNWDLHQGRWSGF